MTAGAVTVEKADPGMMEYKTVGVSGLTVDDDNHGIVTTIVSVTGLVDNVKDVIEVGAYEKTLAVRKPKGAWSHQWETPVSRTLDVKELLPGDPRLPTTLPNGEPWPTDAGALLIKTEFNLETQRGREAYSDVKFFGPDQEWSIGYKVPVGGAEVKNGVRHIRTLDLYEYSPVLFGAMPAARTTSVKDAQVSFKSLMAEVDPHGEFEQKAAMVTDEMPDDEDDEEDKVPQDTGDDEDEEDMKDDYGDLDAKVGRVLSGRNARLIADAIKALQDLLDSAVPAEETKPEGKTIRAESVTEAFRMVFGDLGAKQFDTGYDIALDIDRAVANDDDALAQSLGMKMFDFLDGIAGTKHDLAAVSFGQALASYIEDKDDDTGIEEKPGYPVEDAEEDDEKDDEKSDAPADVSVTELAGLLDEFKDYLPDDYEAKGSRTFTPERREELADEGEALPDGSYPIPDRGALRRAIQSFGRAKDKDKVRRHIMRRARELDAESMIPQNWKG